MRGRHRLQEPGVRTRRIARGAGLEPRFQIRRTVHNPPAQLTIKRTVAVEAEPDGVLSGTPTKWAATLEVMTFGISAIAGPFNPISGKRVN